MSGDGAPVLRMMVSAEPDALILVRRAVSGVALAAGIDGPMLDDVRVAVNEACTNVVVHAYPGEAGSMEVIAWLDDDRLMVTVCDRGAGIVPRAESTSPGLGLGLQMMAALASDVRVAASADGGTEVRLRFDRDGVAGM